MILEEIKNKIMNKAVESTVAALVMLLGWIATQVAPIILPALSKISSNVFLALLLISVVLNFFFSLIIWNLASLTKNKFKLKYGIYWDRDKNPHCPNCKIPIGAYSCYQTAGLGYYCKPCNKVFKLTDASGNDIKPEQVLREL